MTTSLWRASSAAASWRCLVGMTHGVDESDVGFGESLSNQRHEMLDPADRLRRLRGNADARMFVERQHIVLVQDDVEVVEILRQSADLYVGPLADDDRVIPVGPQSRDA